MRMTRVATIAVLMSVTALLAMAGPAAAFQIVKQSGPHGDFGSQVSHSDSSSSPGARCGYSAADQNGNAFLRWIKVYHFLAGARDITSGRDSQQISFQAFVQRQVNGGAWKTVGKSAVQKATGYDDQSASFSDAKIYVHGTSGSQSFRALLTLKWWRNGAVEGSVKVRLQYYSVKWTVGDPNFVYTGSCLGESD